MVRLLEAALRPVVRFFDPVARAADEPVRRILVFEPGSLGDIIMLIPFLKTLRKGFPEASISVVCRSGPSAIGKGYANISHASIETLVLRQGHADELIPVTVPWVRAVASWKRHNPFTPGWPIFARQLYRLRQREFDLAFAGGRSDIRYNLALWLAGARRRIGYGYAGGSFLLTDVVKPDLTRPHQSELPLQASEYLGLETVREGTTLSVSTSDRRSAGDFLRSHGILPGDFVIGIHPGSRVPARTWGEDGFREVARQLIETFRAKIVWLADPADLSAAPKMANLVPAALPLPQFLALLSECKFVICNDSGPMHMSAALGVPVVAVFGSTFPEWYRPPGNLHRVVTRRDVPCRPCGDRCIHDQPYCLRTITVEEVMTEVRGMIETLQPEGKITWASRA
jgi:ADP-heptose:LPS heptosyltransferase